MAKENSKDKNKSSQNRKSQSNFTQGRNMSPEKGMPTGGGSWLRIILFALLLFLILDWLGVFRLGIHIPYSKFRAHLQAGEIAEVTVRGNRIQGKLNKEAELEKESGKPREYKRFRTYVPAFGDEELLSMLKEKEVTVDIKPENKGEWLYMLLFLAPLLLIGAFFYMQYKQMQGGAGGLFNIGKSRAKQYTVIKEKTTFDDVAGGESAKEELQEVVKYLKNPERIRQLGGEVPKGMLLLGPPGCGKTLLARAVAGEAEVPFFSITGSDFMEMFVGVGASRVRDLFRQAKAVAPSIIFIDEIDSIGRQRGAGLGGGHDEREQTLNQLLSEMDGFEGHESVIAMAATNRPDILDPALRRPGRFDRQVVIPAPKLKDRHQILKMYADRKKLASDVDLEGIAKSTPGFSGADLENLLNEAALLAGRKEKEHIGKEDVDQARDKVLMGLTRRGLVLSEEEKRMIAYHEAGHAVASLVLPESTPVHKISIIPRTRAMGVTERFPSEEKYVYKKEYMVSQLCVMMGGRVAEELIFGTATTGAENDLKQATQLAKRMVLEWGMSEDLMNIALGQEQRQVFLGQEMARRQDYSEATAREIDVAVKKMLSQAYDRTKQILEDKRRVLDKVVEQLLKKEEIPGDELKRLLEV